MHHVFIAHSFVTYLVGRLVAAHLSIPRERQTVICSRKFWVNPSDEGIARRFPFDIPPQPFPPHVNVLKAWRKLRILDTLIRECTGRQSFTLYTFDTSTRYNQLIYRLPECREVCVLEEGVGSYLPAEQLATLCCWHRSLKECVCDFLSYGSRIVPCGFLRPGTRVFSLLEEAFPGSDRRTVVWDQSVVDSVCRELLIPLPDDAVIVVHDWGGESILGEYVSLLLYKLEAYRHRPLFQKFHPRQVARDVRTIERIFAQAGVSIQTLPLETPLEGYIFDERCRAEFIGYQSSILMYAQRFGKRASSVFDFEWGSVVAR